MFLPENREDFFDILRLILQEGEGGNPSKEIVEKMLLIFVKL